MQWSRYNLLFKSSGNDWLLYNSGSNSFVQLDDDAAEFVARVKEDPDMDFSANPEMYFKLRGGAFLVEDGSDDDLVRILNMRRTTVNYSGESIVLTVALTKECNFACYYCYEPNRVPSRISDETEDKLVQFVEKHKFANSLHITWYGGEPLLEFDRIKSLTDRFLKLGKKYTASIVTNGYCLTPEIVNSLNDLKILTMQITVDGARETHDKRRYLIGGGKTYDKILENIDLLMNSGWKGGLSVRVNVDTTNSQEFIDVYSTIKDRYPEKYGKTISVYPGFIHMDHEVDSDKSCCFDSEDKGRFVYEMAHEHGIYTLPVFPRMSTGGCTLTKRNAYVVGPDGELYKCWNDIGKEEEVIGTIDKFTNWNMLLVAEGMVEGSYVHDECCNKCFFYPVCGGGCPKIRMLNKRDKGGRDNCSYFKKYARELLEVHYEQKKSKEKSKELQPV